DNLFFLILCDYLLLYKLAAVQFIDGRTLFDLFIEHRIGRRGLIHFIMAVAAVADESDDDVLIERLPVCQCNINGPEYMFGIVGVHMEDRKIKSKSCI